MARSYDKAGLPGHIKSTPRAALGVLRSLPRAREGGPLAVDEVPAKRMIDSIVPGPAG